MSLYGNRDRLFNFEETKTDKRAPPTELYKNGCKSCPLDSAASYLQHPKMVPSGSNYPVIYTIGEAPGSLGYRENTTRVHIRVWWCPFVLGWQIRDWDMAGKILPTTSGKSQTVVLRVSSSGFPTASATSEQW
jgi:hypothetical protein